MNSEEVRTVITDYTKNRIQGPHLVPSAVLVPLLCKDAELHVLLTERTHEVRFHKGQVCFPGGTVQPEDETLLATALREAWEETGVEPGDVEVLGEIDDNVVGSTGYIITPFVGFVPYPYAFAPNAAEAQEIFFVPLSVLMDESLFYVQERVIGEYYYNGPVCDFEGHTIWGATARILKHFTALLRSHGADKNPISCPAS